MATGVIPLWFMGGKFADINDTVPTGRAPSLPPLDAISKIGSGSTPASIVSTRSKRSQSRDDCFVKTALPRYFASFSSRPRALQCREGLWKHGRVFPLLPFCVLPPIPNRINRQIYWTRRRPCQPSLLHANFSRIFRYTRENHESAITVSTVFKLYWSLGIDKSREECACAVQ